MAHAQQKQDSQSQGVGIGMSSNSETGGNFAGVPHEMTDKLMTMNLTPSEWRLVFFFIRHLQGYQMKVKVLKTGQMMKSTGLCKQGVIRALNSLIEKGVIKRDRWSGWDRGEYAYEWGQDLFERTHATKEVRHDPKVIHLENYMERRSNNIETSKSQKCNSEVTVLRPQGNSPETSKPPKTKPRAALGVPKDSIKDKRKILKKENFKDFNFFESKTKELTPEERELQLKWLKATEGKQSFDEWRKLS